MQWNRRFWQNFKDYHDYRERAKIESWFYYRKNEIHTSNKKYKGGYLYNRIIKLSSSKLSIISFVYNYDKSLRNGINYSILLSVIVYSLCFNYFSVVFEIKNVEDSYIRQETRSSKYQTYYGIFLNCWTINFSYLVNKCLNLVILHQVRTTNYISDVFFEYVF